MGAFSAISREVKEETNLEVISADFLREDVEEYEHEGIRYFISYFYVKVSDCRVFKHKERAKTDLWHWFFEDEMPRRDNRLGQIAYGGLI